MPVLINLARAKVDTMYETVLESQGPIGRDIETLHEAQGDHGKPVLRDQVANSHNFLNLLAKPEVLVHQVPGHRDHLPAKEPVHLVPHLKDEAG